LIKLICFVKRKPGMSPEDFHKHWGEVHGPLIANSEGGKYVLRYERNPRPIADYERTGPADGYDGCTIQWFASIDDFWKSSMMDFDEVQADVERFIDTDALQWILTEEPDVVIDRL
jgi:uncharacterized protein (TIGR02118 family)